MPRAGEAIILDGFDFLRPEIAGVYASTISGMEGWWTKPAVVNDDHQLIADDGEVPSERRYGPRLISIAGDVSCHSRAAMFAFRDRIASLVSHRAVRLEVQGHGPDQWANVVESGEMDWQEKSPVAARWQLQLKAPDPRKYGVTRRFPATGTSPARTAVSVSHEGNYPAAPRITVTGYMPQGFTAFGTGSDRFRVTEGVNTGEVLVADFKSGHVTLDGVRKPAAGGYRSLARVAPYISRATNVIPATEAGTGSYFVEVTDTWI